MFTLYLVLRWFDAAVHAEAEISGVGIVCNKGSHGLPPKVKERL